MWLKFCRHMSVWLFLTTFFVFYYYCCWCSHVFQRSPWWCVWSLLVIRQSFHCFGISRQQCHCLGYTERWEQTSLLRGHQNGVMVLKLLVCQYCCNFYYLGLSELSTITIPSYYFHDHYYHRFLNGEGLWGTTDDFATSFLHFILFSTALWDLANSRLLSALSSSPFHCALQGVFGQTWWTGNVTIPLQFAPLSSGLHVVQLPAGSWHGLPRW